MSWSLSREVASKFPFYNRYRCSEPLLITGRVQKSDIIALKLDREEQEVIAYEVELISGEFLTPTQSSTDSEIPAQVTVS